jgi:alkylation response protein AidB-like acyl-CoA dehydrogenase
LNAAILEAERAAQRSESARMIRESAEVVLRNDLPRARALRFGGYRFDARAWSQFADLGWLMIRLATDRGGLGLGLSEMCALAEQMGRVLTPEPVLSVALIANLLPDSLLQPVLSGERVVLPAFAVFDGTAPSGDGAGISGTAEPTQGEATAYIVQTTSGAVLVESGARGLRVEPRAVHDGGYLTTLSFEGTAGTVLGGGLDDVREEAALLHAAYLLGLSDAAFELTIGYLREREQFGRLIGSFQAIQHRCVDLYLELALTRAAVESAATVLDEGATGKARQRSVSLAKARATLAAAQVTREAVQLHGGIGYTDEADIGLYLRKSMTVAGLFGSERFHRLRAYGLQEQVA